MEVRVFNPPRLTARCWIRRNHRKLITVDGRIGFVSGLCISDKWVGKERRTPWRDTGIVLGPMVADLDAAFAESWADAGGDPGSRAAPMPTDSACGDRAGAGQRAEPGMLPYRLDQLIAATAQRNLWLTDAYFVATTSYVQALRPAARDGVDVAFSCRARATCRPCSRWSGRATAR